MEKLFGKTPSPTRILVFLLFALIGYALKPWGMKPLEGMLLGAFLGGATLYLERRIPQMSLNVVLGGWIGLLCGALASLLFNRALSITSPERFEKNQFVFVTAILIFCYLGVRIGAHFGQWLDSNTIRELFGKKTPPSFNKILDTSVIIDGRIADVAEAGFLDGDIVVPQFVLNELQFIADSGDALKRTRGRKGLDLLQRMQKNRALNIVIVDYDFPDVKAVDQKLIELASRRGGKIVTNDYNLNRVARLRGIEVLNLNDLANAMRPVVLPGETMEVFVLKEGKERSQGVGYLDDGTMVVVDNGCGLIGQTVRLSVTSVLQTSAGKMIFGEAAPGGTPAGQGAAAGEKSQ
jgi:uncharacterized protein YacL